MPYYAYPYFYQLIYVKVKRMKTKESKQLRPLAFFIKV